MNISKANLGFKGNYCIDACTEKQAVNLAKTYSKLDKLPKSVEIGVKTVGTKVYVGTRHPQFSNPDKHIIMQGLLNSNLSRPYSFDLINKANNAFDQYAETQGWIG